MISRTLTHAAAAAALLCSTTGAMANSYVLSGDLTYETFFNHGNNGSFRLTVETADPLGTDFTTVTAISGTFMGQTVTGLSTWFGADGQIRDTDRPFTFDGMAFAFTPLAGSYFPGQRDDVASLWVSSGGVMRALIGHTASGNTDSSSYTVSNFTISAVPEPGTYAMMGLGLLGLAAAARRRQKAH